MSSGVLYYLSGLAILLGINVIAIWGLDLQFGLAGINNFAFVVFQASGAYAAALLALKPASAYGSFETYIGGWNLPFPLPLVGAAAVGGLVAVPIGLVAVRRLRGDYQAMAMLVLSLIATGFAEAQTGLVNGPTGLALIPRPFAGAFHLSPLGEQWVFLGLTAVCCAVAWWVARGISRSPLGRLLRAVRDSESAVSALGRDPQALRMTALVVGGALAGLSGGLLVEYVNAWGPASWLYPETFLFFTALVVGGRGNLAGGALGALLVPIGIVEGTRYLPSFGYPGLIDSLDWVVIGLVMLVFLWFRPLGLFPERKRVVRFGDAPARRGAPVAMSARRAETP
ncbi:MAG TPA: branched-chain amino acid ABC transporter permease [Acidimicrobiales bacterium]|nr:branched-chain amino acid ABC transporter permease [Acidimicrobiales bacterium]